MITSRLTLGLAMSVLLVACGGAEDEVAAGPSPQDDVAPNPGSRRNPHPVTPAEEQPDPAPEQPAAGTYAVGTELITTDDLNLRDGPGTDHAVLDVMPMGSRVTVVTESGADGWVNVVWGSLVGWASSDYLALAPPLPGYDPVRAKILADTAVAMWSGSSSGGLCLKGVRLSAEASGIVPDPPGWPIFPSAIDWGEWAVGNPGALAQRGFVRDESLGVNELPQGTIIVWQPGQCGYDSTYGHIEIVVDTASSKACSDFCGKVKKTCGDPWVFLPTVL